MSIVTHFGPLGSQGPLQVATWVGSFLSLVALWGALASGGLFLGGLGVYFWWSWDALVCATPYEEVFLRALELLACRCIKRSFVFCPEKFRVLYEIYLSTFICFPLTYAYIWSDLYLAICLGQALYYLTRGGPRTGILSDCGAWV